MVKQKYLAVLLAVGMAVSLSACADRAAQNTSSPTASVKRTAVWTKKRPAVTASLSERDCLARAMYFESNRSSPEGMLAVGSVVMNRYESGRYGNSICNVVGAPRQFAPGVLSRPMADRSAPVARGVADAVLSGDRHAQVGRAMHFHMAGLRFGYNNMHYVTVAGGNAFYEKRDRHFYNSEPTMVASNQSPVQSVAFDQSDDNTRMGAVITDLNGTSAPVAQRSIVAVDPAPVVTAYAASSTTAIDKPAVAALLDLAPLPPKRPKMLGEAASPDKHVSAPSTLRVAGIR